MAHGRFLAGREILSVDLLIEEDRARQSAIGFAHAEQAAGCSFGRWHAGEELRARIMGQCLVEALREGSEVPLDAIGRPGGDKQRGKSSRLFVRTDDRCMNVGSIEYCFFHPFRADVAAIRTNDEVILAPVHDQLAIGIYFSKVSGVPFAFA